MGRYIRTLARRKTQRATFDLFGDIPVTTDDIQLWITALGLQLGSKRTEWYVRAYHVIDKIKAAKRRGEWPPTPETQRKR